MIREKRTVNCWLLTKSKRKKGKERRKRKKRKGGKEEEGKKERKKTKEKREGEKGKEEKKEREEEKTKKAWKEIKATAKGNLQKPLQLPFILPIELITAFFYFQKPFHPVRSATYLSDAYKPFLIFYRPFSNALQAFLKLIFSETQPQ